MEKELFRTRLIFSAIIVVAFLLGGYLWQKNTAIAPTAQNEMTIVNGEAEVVNAYLEIEGIYENEVAIQALAGQTLLGVMRQLNESEPSLNLLTQDYPGLGSLVIQIGSWSNGLDNKYWQYEVNDTVPMIGADQYVVQSGDKIKWEFKQSEF
jgi:hypothetical protein